MSHVTLHLLEILLGKYCTPTTGEQGETLGAPVDSDSDFDVMFCTPSSKL